MDPAKESYERYPIKPLSPESMHRTQDLADRVINNITDYGIIVLDPEGHVVSWNKGAERILGYEAEEIQGQHFSLFYTEQDREQDKPAKELAHAKREGRYEEEGPRLRKNGQKFWVNTIIHPLYEKEQLIGFTKITRDISQKKEAEKNYELLIDAVQDYGIFMLDPSGIILSWNPGAERLKGYKAEEIIGQHFSKFYTPDDKMTGHPARELNLAATNGKYEEEGWRVKKDGTRFWANVVISRINSKEGQLIGYTKITRDLSERKRAEEAMRESEERFRLMVDNVKDYAIISLDPAGHITTWNAGAEKIKGWKSQEIIGRHFSNFYLPEDIKAGKAEEELKVATREGRFEDFGWRIRKDGTRFWANVVVTALKNEDGELKGFVKITRDITEQKKAEDELKKAHLELEKKVEDRTHALKVANKELEAFTYAVSHDLRAPIRSIEGFTNALVKNYSEQLDDRGRDYLKRVVQSAQRMAKLIDDLLDLSRLGRTEIRKTTVNLSYLADEIFTALKKDNPDREVELVKPPQVNAFGDPNLLRVAMENLISNSWKYSSKNPRARIEFGEIKQKGKSIYYIKDDGAGFNMAYADKLFGTFQRLHSPKEFSGTGVGLSTVKRIIERHGGEIWAQSEVDKGATFFFTLSPK